MWHDDITEFYKTVFGVGIPARRPSEALSLAVFESAVADLTKYQHTNPTPDPRVTHRFYRDREAEWWRDAYVWLTTPDVDLSGVGDWEREQLRRYCDVCEPGHGVFSLTWVASCLQLDQDVLMEMVEVTVDRWIRQGELGPINVESVQLIREQRRVEENGEVWDREEIRDRGEIWLRRGCAAGAAELVRPRRRKPRRS